MTRLKLRAQLKSARRRLEVAVANGEPPAECRRLRRAVEQLERRLERKPEPADARPWWDE
jgi:hypothetical protein